MRTSVNTPPRKLPSGFTLIELIAVIVVLSIIATISTGFVISSMESYVETQDRAKLINRGRQAIEQITRRIRGATPNSIRITNGGNCLEFLPLASGGNYLNPVPDLSNGASASNTIITAAHSANLVNALYVIIGANNNGDIYSGGSLATLASSTPALLTLTANKIWTRNSPTRRFFLADNPEAFCLNGSDLRHYSGYATPLTTTGTPGGTGVLMGQNASVGSSGSTFSIEAGTETRGAVVIVDLLFTENNQQVPIRQEVFVRNVP